MHTFIISDQQFIVFRFIDIDTGDSCDESTTVCQDSNAECTNNTCVCVDEYTEINGVCVICKYFRKF